MPRPYPFKRKPYEHQMDGLKFALKNKRVALLMDPRTGKTKTAIDYLSALSLAGRLDRAVIVAPARVLDVWVQAFMDDCPVNYHIHIWDARARQQPPPKVNGVYDLSVILINYEAFSVSGPELKNAQGKVTGRSKKSGRYKTRQQIERWLEGRSGAMILDESHKIKSPSGKTSTMIVSMRAFFEYRLILTGTPITKAKRAFDIYMQWKFLNPDRFKEWPTAEIFRNHFGVWHDTKQGYKEFKRLQNEDVLTERIHLDSFRVKRSDCFDLPPRSERFIRLDLNKSTAMAYDELAREMVAQIEHNQRTHTIEATIALTLTLRLTQITGGFATTPEKNVLPVGREKLDALDGLFEETLENDDKMVVAARFKPEMNAIVQLATKRRLPVYEVRGGLTREQTTENIKRFKDEPGAAVLVMQPQAGGVGIDLSSASHMVWYSLTSSWVDYTQSCDRIALSKKATTYTYLLAKGTVDDVLYDVLKDDGEVAESILKDPRKVLRK